jgi:hypothetical protein
MTFRSLMVGDFFGFIVDRNLFPDRPRWAGFWQRLNLLVREWFQEEPWERSLWMNLIPDNCR